MAQRIRHGEGAWAWDENAIEQAFDEVELLHDGQRLRIDRLVYRHAHGAHPAGWWVLDFKSAHQPGRDPLLLEQMARYREALQAAHPDQPVACAFLSGDGRMEQVHG